MRESDIEDYLVKRVGELGGEVRKVKWIGRNKAPDRAVMAIFLSPALVWVEVKRPGGKAKFPSNPHERAQHREHERMREQGQRVEVIDSYEGVDELLRGSHGLT